ncbi:MAG: hypothetical protein KGL39_27280 [Patescibacteria group bacterium]|nr:hypothetical protein [Patescibacteria group bacterium]
MRDDFQSYRQTGWLAEQVRLMPQLLMVKPWGHEGEHTIFTKAGQEPVLFYLDHGWDSLFGYTFGTVGAVGTEADKRLDGQVRRGDFIYFTRCAYESAVDHNGQRWLFMHWENAQGKIEPNPDPEHLERNETTTETRMA